MPKGVYKRNQRQTKPVEAAEQKVGQDRPREMLATGDAEIEAPVIEPVEGPVQKDKLEELKFMNEEVEIHLHDSTEKNAEPVVRVGVNGRNQFFIRGKPQKVKRMFVEALARAKKTTYSQQLMADNEGASGYKNIPSTALQYPFSVIHDPNPRGADWLRKVLAEG